MTTNEDTRVRFKGDKVAALLSKANKGELSDIEEETENLEKKDATEVSINMIRFPGTKNNLGTMCEVFGKQIVGLMDNGSGVCAIKTPVWKKTNKTYY